MRKPFFKAVVAGMASVAMIAGMSACGRSANNADSDSDCGQDHRFKQGHRRPDHLGHGQRGRPAG